MPAELMKDFIGKQCLITMLNENSPRTVTILGAVDGWIKVEELNSISILNCSTIKDIQLINNNKEQSLTEDTDIKNNEPERNSKSLMDNAVILTHGDYWYRAYGDSAYVLSFITDYKLFEDSNTKRPAVSFPIDSIDKVISLLNKNKINYYLKYEDIYKDFGEENNFKNFIHKDLPFSYIKENEVIKKIPKGSFKVQYEGENPEEYVIGEDISEDAELTKKVEESNIGDVIEINQYKIRVIEKNINYN